LGALSPQRLLELLCCCELLLGTTLELLDVAMLLEDGVLQYANTHSLLLDNGLISSLLEEDG
jgi:hypothetical protein